MALPIAAAITTLLSYYNHSSGYFGNASVYWPFWHSGNSLETLALAYSLTGDTRIPPILANSFAKVRADYHTPYAGNDDIQWHAHARGDGQRDLPSRGGGHLHAAAGPHLAGLERHLPGLQLGRKRAFRVGYYLC